MKLSNCVVVLAVSIVPLALHAQTNVIVQPNCFVPFTLAATGNAPTTVANNGPGDNRQKGCSNWTLKYQSSGFSVVSVTFQSGASPSTTVSFGSFAGTTVTGTNPMTSTTGGEATFTNSTATISWVRVSLTVTGTGTVSGVLYGTPNGLANNGGGGGGTGTVTGVGTGCFLTGGTITVTGTIKASEVVNPQTGTTYTFQDSDCGKLVTQTNAMAIAGTLPQANGSTFVAGWFVDVENRGAGTLTITPTTSTIDGASSLALTTNQGVRIVSDGTNYFTAGRGISSSVPCTTTALSLQYNNAGAFGCIVNWTANGTNIFLTAIAAPATPAAGKGVPYVDSTSKNFALKNDAGTVNHGVQTKAAVTHAFLTSIADDGSSGQGQPACGDLSDAVSTCNSLNSPAFTGNPTAPTQAASDNSTRLATTAYVTTGIANAVAGVNPAVAVQAATTAASDTSGFTYNNGVAGIGATFTGSVNTAVTIDGFTFTALGQRLLVKNDTQSPSGAFNGVYYVTQVQTGILPPILTRALDYDAPADINNTGAIPVVNGTANALTSWLLTSTVNTVGTDPLTYVRFSINPSTTVSTTGLTTGKVPKAASSTSLGDSNITENADGSDNASKAITYASPSAPTFNAGGTTTCDFSASNVCGFTMSGNTTLAVTNPHGSGPYLLKVTQDGTGGRTISYPASFSNVCQPSGTASVVTNILLIFDGSATYYEVSCVSNDTPTLISGPERAAATTTIAANGALSFASGSHTAEYYANNSANRHIMGRTAGSTDQFACADLSNGATGCSATALPPNGAAGGDLSGTYPNPGVAKINGTSFAGTNGHLVSFGAANIPADSGIVASTVTKTIASGTKALATGAISSATCTTAQTATATGTLTTDTIVATFNGDPTAVTGYVPLTAGMLTIIIYPTADTFNAKVCNNTSSSITPGAITLNFSVFR